MAQAVGVDMRVWVWAVVAALLVLGPQARAETRVALVVGNSAYQAAPALTNPLNDARDMSAALKAAGFTVVEALDADRRKFDGALRAFADQLGKADVAVFFYAGHGIQVGQQNYLVPVDAKLERERDLEFEAVQLDFVMRQLEIDREGKTTIVFLDACRDNPFARNLARSMGTRGTSVGRGLAAAATGLGTFIAYSTQPGNVALDGEGRNSPFTSALVRHMSAKGRNLPATLIEVRKDVVAATGGKQVPWDHSAMTGEFFFMGGAASPSPGSIAAAPKGTDVDVAALQERLRKLEDDAKKRDAAAPAAVLAKPVAQSALPPVISRAKPAATMTIAENVRIDGIKIREERRPSPAACRDACEAEPDCAGFQHGRRVPVMGLCQLYARIDARYEDPSWRSGVRPDAVPQRPEVAEPVASRRIAAKIGVPMSRKEQGFEIYEGVAVMGDQIKMSSADSASGCRAVCRNTPGCAAAAYNDFFRGKNVACQVYREINSVMQTPSSIIMVRGE
ncbi:MAG: caspase family protein [Hyphomicrobiaceae bacterium]